MVLRNDGAFPILIAVGDGFGQGPLFEVNKMIDDLPQFGTRNRRDLEPFARIQRDKAFRHQL